MGKRVPVERERDRCQLWLAEAYAQQGLFASFLSSQLLLNFVTSLLDQQNQSSF